MQHFLFITIISACVTTIFGDYLNHRGHDLHFGDHHRPLFNEPIVIHGARSRLHEGVHELPDQVHHKLSHYGLDHGLHGIPHYKEHALGHGLHGIVHSKDHGFNQHGLNHELYGIHHQGLAHGLHGKYVDSPIVTHRGLNHGYHGKSLGHGELPYINVGHGIYGDANHKVHDKHVYRHGLGIHGHLLRGGHHHFDRFHKY